MKTKHKILIAAKDPIQISDIQDIVDTSLPNISKHIKRLEREGFIKQVGRIKNSTVVQVDKGNLERYIKRQQNEIDALKKAIE